MAHAVQPIFQEMPPQGPRDVLALVNTNAMMAALALDCADRLYASLRAAITITAKQSYALHTSDEPFGEGLLIKTSFPSYAAIGQRIIEERKKLRAQYGTQSPDEALIPLQERYSIRCAPQILGTVEDQLYFAVDRITAEAEAVADNPIILESGSPWHGGLFYSAGLALSADLMMDALGRIAELIERQTFLLVDPLLSHGLPRNLTVDEGDHVKGIHQLASALLQNIKSISIPTRLTTTPAEGYNQDVVPGSMSALCTLEKALQLFDHLLRCGSFIASRAVLLRASCTVPSSLRLSKWTEFALDVDPI